MTINVAVLGATGAVGEALLEILAERNFPLNELYPLASHRSAGNTVMFKGKPLIVDDVAEFDFSKVQLCLFSAGGSVSREYAPKAAAAGCVVIDNTSEFRYDDDIPLVVPEVNPKAIADYETKRIIANPNCSTIQMVVALKPIYDAVGIERINVATYQAVSGSGRKAMLELAQQTGELLNGRPIKSSVYPKQIAFNVLPQIDNWQDNGYTREEMKMVWETRKLLADDNIQVNPTAVRVPVFFGHSEAIHLETRDKISAQAAIDVLKSAPGVVVIEDAVSADYPTPAAGVSGQDAVFVGRVREDISHPKGLDLWVVADNIRKGAALNAIQIAEKLLEGYQPW